MTSRLADPWLLLLALLLVVRVVILAADRRRRRGAFGFSSLALTGEARPRPFATWLPLGLELAGWALLAFALARPQHVISISADDRSGIDLVIALDASGSMAAEDFRPQNRFAVAKDILANFILRRENDRIGIVTFGSRAATRVPVTFDHDVALEILDRAEIGQNGDGTAIGHAVATAVNRLRNSKARSRVIVLVTDGVNNSGSIEPATAATLASRFGIRIYTIGVGSRGAVPIPLKVQNRFTGEIETLYHVIRADLDEPLLAAIARSTGGHYFRAVDPGALEAVLEQIDGLEKSRLTAPRRQTYRELYPRPLAAGLGAIALALFLGETLWMKLPS